jgi:hypothetical protein
VSGLHKMGPAVVVESPAGTIIYATNVVPMLAEIRFPAFFTDEDKRRTYEAIRLIYDEAAGREDR